MDEWFLGMQGLALLKDLPRKTTVITTSCCGIGTARGSTSIKPARKWGSLTARAPGALKKGVLTGKAVLPGGREEA